jgi:hypothetical protein
VKAETRHQWNVYRYQRRRTRQGYESDINDGKISLNDVETLDQVPRRRGPDVVDLLGYGQGSVVNQER